MYGRRQNEQRVTRVSLRQARIERDSIHERLEKSCELSVPEMELLVDD
jgi:hypothetical protein